MGRASWENANLIILIHGLNAFMASHCSGDKDGNPPQPLLEPPFLLVLQFLRKAALFGASGPLHRWTPLLGVLSFLSPFTLSLVPTQSGNVTSLRKHS